MAPLPVLDDDDPVLAQVMRLTGIVAVVGVPQNVEGMTLDDIKAACYANREELADDLANAQDMVVRSDRDGWAQDTELRWSSADDVLVDADTSQAWAGTWILDETEEPRTWGDIAYVTGYSYDLFGAGSDVLEMLAARLKMAFSFSDSSGNYERQEKYQQVIDIGMRLRARAALHQPEMTREDTSVGGSMDAFDRG